MADSVDPFIGCEVTDLAEPAGLAATWWSPKPRVGNTHPGACSPLGMVSAVAYSGAYPSGYGLYDKSTEAIPDQVYDQYRSSGFTHFQQSGTGAIRKYYNYARVTPMLSPLEELIDGRTGPDAASWPLRNETARPGYYRADLELDPQHSVGCELTVGPKSAVHRYRFPAAGDARVVIDLSCGGLTIPHGRTIPMRAALQLLEPGRAQAQVMVEGVPLSVAVEIDAESWRHMLWFDARLIEGGSRLDLESIRRTTFRPFGFIFRGPGDPEQPVEVRLGFSLRSCEQAWSNLEADPVDSTGVTNFDARRAGTESQWREHLGQIEVSGGSDEQRTVFATALYHSLIKPCFADDESPFWSDDGPFVFDICTMWDIYKTQIPLLFALAPKRAVDLLNALTKVCEQEGNYPIGYRMARGADRFFRQASALAHTALADGFDLGVGGLDWEWVLAHMHDDLRRTYGEDFLDRGVVHPVSHTLDLAHGYHCTALVARGLGDERLANSMDDRAANWVNAFDADTGLLRDSTFYEGGAWNYSFRLVHDMAGRIDLAGGNAGFVELLDRFFGFDAEPVSQLGANFTDAELEAGYALNRFQGLNNEPDMEAPYAYHYAGRPDRTAEVINAILTYQFGPSRGGLPGNDDSGGLSSWYVWASLGLFPVAGRNRFLVSSPAFSRSVINIAGQQFTISTSGFVERARGVGAQYIQQAWLDGEPLEQPMISGRKLHAGGELHLHLGPSPSKWGHDHLPT